jgi:uncharacterized protein with PQ loop repeat
VAALLDLIKKEMVLLFAVLAGLLAGSGWAHWHKQAYAAPGLQAAWLAVIAFLPQLLIAYLPATRQLLSDGFASVSLVVSLTLFLIFAWSNRHLPGMPILIIGLLLNFVVIVANGGWMPISLQTANLLTGKNVLQFMGLGSRFGEKDILLLAQNIHFEFLADRFLFPAWFPYKTAFSLGDILISMGAFWLLAKPDAKLLSLSKEGIAV